MTSHKKKILIIACGGTIACTQDEQGQARQTLSAQHLVQGIPQLTELATVETHQFRQIGSASITLADVAELAGLIHTQAYDGYVITHGTDTIEETAFALDMLYTGAEPVVLTGAMRHASLPGADGDANLLAAVLTAIDDRSLNRGILVVLNDTVHSAQLVRKAHSTRPDAFVSSPAGPLGWINEKSVVYVSTVPRQPLIEPNLLDKLQLASCPEVPIIATWSGDRGELLRLIAQSGKYSAVIIDALGGGHVSESLALEIEQATSDEILVIISTRTGDGSTLFATYASDGSEIDLLKKGVVMAAWRSAVQSRIIVQLLRSAGFCNSQIKERFKLACGYN